MTDPPQPSDADRLPTLPAWVGGAARPVVPERIGTFRLREKIGEGGAGEVWAAHDESLDRAVAVKLVYRTGVGAEQETRLLREAHALAKLSHPNVVTVHDADRCGDYVYIAMELAQGGTLKEAFADPDRGPDERIALLLQAARGLQAAHSLGLVHRDFKPANALLGADGRVRVADFGLARLADAHGESLEDAAGEVGLTPMFTDLTVTGAILGTPAYMSPEQRLGQPVTAASDQFSFCVVAWQALYGTNPLADLNLAAWVAGDIALPRPPSTAGVSPALHAALERGLNPEPEARHASMEPLIAALAKAIAPPSSRGRIALLAGLGAATLAALAVLAWPSETTIDCATPPLDWAATRHIRLATTQLRGAPLQSASSGLHTIAASWDRTRDEACNEALPLSPCAQNRRAAYAELGDHLGPGPTRLPEMLQAVQDACSPDAAPTPDVARLHVRMAAGETQAVLDACLELERTVTRPRVRAAILHLHGRAQAELGDLDGAFETLRVAYNHAERAGAHALATTAAADLAVLTMVELGQPARGRGWLELAEARPAPTRRAAVAVHMARGRVFDARDAWTDAARAYLDAAAQLEDSADFTDGPSDARLRAAAALSNAGDRTAAEALLRPVVEHRTRVYGAEHPRTVTARAQLARL